MSEREIFIDAMHRTNSTERAQFLDVACAGDDALKNRILQLLAENIRLGSFLEEPGILIGARNASNVVGEVAGNRIGCYQLLEEIGHGGMGTVFLAEQVQPVRRTVALKIIKPGMDSAEILSRFQSERQALEMMDHPNIARVMDAGTTLAGMPYFVMELVQGEAITDYCDKNRLNLRERLELFIPVCKAIQHAHQKGIIHRDIKPSNVLIRVLDGKPVPKVIDFGIAKAINQQLTDRTIFTQLGQIVGTLEYMSPEQAEMNGGNVDTRSDIYSLGVLAYELLTGSTPLQRSKLVERGYSELLQMIRETNPPKPSTRLKASGIELADISEHRKMDPTDLKRVVRGELDWIVMKAMDKDRGRRYGTSSDLARDVERYLADEPVEACPPSQLYLLRKLIRRNRGLAFASTLIFLALIFGVIGTTWGMVSANTAREAEAKQRAIAEQRRLLAEQNQRAAVVQKQVAEAVQKFLQHDLLRQANAKEQADSILKHGGGFEIKENPTVKELLDRAASELSPSKIDSKFPDQPAVQATILQTIGDTYLSIGEYDKAIEFLRRAIDLDTDLIGDDQPATLSAMLSLACAYRERGEFSKTIPLIEKVLEGQVKLFGLDSPETLDSEYKLAIAMRMASRLTEAVELFERVYSAQVKKLGSEHQDTLNTKKSLTWASYIRDTNAAKAIATFEEIIAVQVRTLGEEHPETLDTRSSHAVVFIDTHDMPRALELLTGVSDACVKTLGAEHPDTLAARHNVAVGYSSNGNSAQAIAMFKELYAIEVQKLGVDYSLTRTTLAYLARILWLSGEREESLSLYRQLAGIVEKRKFRDEFDVRRMNGVINRLQEAEYFEEAENWWRRWLDVLKSQPDSDQHLIAINLMGLGDNLLKQQRYTESEHALRESLALAEELAKTPKTIYKGLPHMDANMISNAKKLLVEVLSELAK